MGKWIITEKIFAVMALAIDLMKEHKVDYLKFDFCNDKSCKGKCSDDTIYLNYEYAMQSDMDEIKNTILHEIAHAIAGIENAHNEYWKSIAIHIGVKIKN